MRDPRAVNLEAQRVFCVLRDALRGRPTRRGSTRKEAEASEPFGVGRDPTALADALGALGARLGWTDRLREYAVLTEWHDVVGAEVAAHAVPLGMRETVLEVQCDSTAWATQLRFLRPQLLGRLAERFPDTAITDLHFRGPAAPSWKKGPRSVPGRGQRDTYG